MIKKAYVLNKLFHFASNHILNLIMVALILFCEREIYQGFILNLLVSCQNFVLKVKENGKGFRNTPTPPNNLSWDHTPFFFFLLVMHIIKFMYIVRYAKAVLHWK